MLQSIQNKIRSLQKAREIIQTWKDNGDQIVWTNGCFDILHLGHIKYLIEAKALGQRLIVGLNSDHSVGKLKGGHRPIMDQRSREFILAAMQMIDLVVPFESVTPIQEILSLQPHILVKGGDYNKNQIIGSKEVEAWGGKVVIIPLEKGHSSTLIIEKIKKL